MKLTTTLQASAADQQVVQGSTSTSRAFVRLGDSKGAHALPVHGALQHIKTAAALQMLDAMSTCYLHAGYKLEALSAIQPLFEQQ